jgi:hypothetical protein
MKQYVLLFFYVALLMNLSFAQSKAIITGIVQNFENAAPVPGCSVFISNTSKGTSTNAKGSFELNNISPGKYELIVSSIGYETYIHSFTDKELPLTLRISLKMKATELPDVTVEPYLENGWEEWGIFFMSNFIGTSNNAFHCRIQNKKVIHFRYSQKRKVLTAIADEPLIIENEALGYSIRFELEEFMYDENSNIINCYGYSLFEEKISSNKKTREHWNSNRKNAYFGSIMHFMRSLYANQLMEEGFQLKQLINVPDTLSLSVSDIVRSDQDKMTSLFFTGKLFVSYKNNNEKKSDQSTINLLTPVPVKIEANGNYYPPEELFTSGYWASSVKIVNLLPYEYVPVDEKTGD